MQCVTAVEATWLAEMGPPCSTLWNKLAPEGSQKRRQAQETMSTMEEEMKLAQEQMIAEKEEQIKKEASIRKKLVLLIFYFIPKPIRINVLLCF